VTGNATKRTGKLAFQEQQRTSKTNLGIVRNDCEQV
jgi:hypothetical protein